MEERRIKVWFDEKTGTAGRRLVEHLPGAIRSVKTVTFLCGTSGLGPGQEFEFDHAVQEAYSARKPLIPVLLPGADPTQMNESLKNFLRVRFEHDLSEADPLARLEEAITGAPPGAVRPHELAELFAILEVAEIPVPVAKRSFFRLKEILAAWLGEMPEHPGFPAFAEICATWLHHREQCPLLSYAAACKSALAPLREDQEVRFDAWAGYLADRFGADAASLLNEASASGPESAHVLVKIAPDRLEGAGKFHVDVWTQTSEYAAEPFFSTSQAPPEAGASSVDRTELAATLEKLMDVLTEERRDLEPDQVHVFLPWELIEEPIHAWPAGLQGETPCMIGERHRLCVRSYEQALAKKCSSLWRKKWEGCRAAIEDGGFRSARTKVYLQLQS